MEKNMGLENENLISELNHGKKLANQLKKQLEHCSSQETRDLLAAEIVCSYEKALSLLKQSALFGETKPIIESSSPFGSPRSKICDQDFNQKDIYKKRKTMLRWTEQVKVCSESSGLEGPADDGYSWRKYGQKDILGANHPRSYYRCTHRHVQGCLATKQVQRLNEDPSILEVTYRGRHTCRQSGTLNKQALKGNKSISQQQNVVEKPKHSQQMLCNHGAAVGLKVETEDLDTREEEDIFPLFTFSSTPTECENVENQIFSNSMIETSCFSVSPFFMTSFELGDTVQTSESELTEILSAPTSVTNSPIGDLDLPFNNDDFELIFSSDSLEFFY